jgi:hypothetical protein
LKTVATYVCVPAAAVRVAAVVYNPFIRIIISLFKSLPKSVCSVTAHVIPPPEVLSVISENTRKKD